MAKAFCKMIAGQVCLTTAVLADVLGVEPRTIQEWNSRGCPKAARGWWSIRDVLTWRGLISPAGVNTEAEAEKVSWQQLKIEFEAKLKEQQAETAAFKNAVLQGEYIKREDIIAELQRFFVIFKRSVLAIPRRLATELGAHVDIVTARRMEKGMTELVNDALEQLSIDGIYKAPRRKKARS
ncbi:MAG: hypothetical protein ACOX8W_06495 [bacterium]|jgi:phage terminase Nu1 subunit (DNA packaging protein)